MEETLPEGWKAKKRKIELLEGWGLRTSLQEGNPTEEDGKMELTRKLDWNDIQGSLLVGKNSNEKQTRITAWTEVDEIVPKGRNAGKA